MKYTVGTKVVIVSERPIGDWNPEMDKYLGQVMTIRKVGRYAYKMEEDAAEHFGDGWNWEDHFINHEATSESEYADSYSIEYYTDKVYDLFSDLDNKGVLFYDDCRYSREGIRANVKEWHKQKSKLFALFSKHPNWNEEAKAIVFLKTEHRQPDSQMFKMYAGDILDRMYSHITMPDNISTTPNNIMSKIHRLDTWNERCENAGVDPADWGFYSHTECDVLKHIFALIANMNPLNVLDKRAADRINGFYPSLRARAGMKTSRVVNKLFSLFGFDKLSEYNRIFAKLSDSLNPFDVERITVLSLNIIDFLMMSHGNSWRSCHTIINDDGENNYGGCYKGGTLSYANDGESIIMYTIDKGYTGTDYCLEPKITRQVLFWDYPVLVQERLYPQCNDGTEQGESLVKQYRTIAEEVIATCLGMPNLWVKENRNRANITARDDTFMYEDWEHFKNYIVHIKKDNVVSDSEIEEGEDASVYSGGYVVRSAKMIAVGGSSFCTYCGKKKIYDDYRDNSKSEQTLLCPICCQDGVVICSDCGDEVDESDAVYYNGEWYCQDCCTYCEYHERYEPDCENHFADVEGYGTVCEDALDEGDFYQCDHCGEWFSSRSRVIEYDDEYLCPDCFEEVGAFCENCGKPCLVDNMEEIDGCLFCEDCAEEILNDEAEETA